MGVESAAAAAVAAAPGVAALPFGAAALSGAPLEAAGFDCGVLAGTADAGARGGWTGAL